MSIRQVTNRKLAEVPLSGAAKAPAATLRCLDPGRERSAVLRWRLTMSAGLHHRSALLRTLAAATAALVLAAPALADQPRKHEPWQASGEVQRVYDGDTFSLRTTDHGVVRVRFSGIDTPERGQAFSRRATDELVRQLRQGPVTVRCFKDDGRGREVCDVYAGGNDVGLALLERGLAWHFKRFAAEQTPEKRAAYSEAEQAARQARRGLWAVDAPMPPWECRQARRAGGTCR